MAPGWIGAWMQWLMGGHRREYIQPPRNLLKVCGLWVWPSARCYCLLHCFIPIDRRRSWPLSIMTFYKHSGKKESVISALLLLLCCHWKFWWTVFGLCCFFYNDFSMILSSLSVVLIQNVMFGWENSKWIVINFTLKKHFFRQTLNLNFSIFFNWQQKKLTFWTYFVIVYHIQIAIVRKCKT